MSLKSKGQLFSTDFMIACTVFVLTISILFVYWAYTRNRIEETTLITDMIEKAYLISEIWFREGIPEYWNTTNVIDLGLSNNHRFNRTKMDSLGNPPLDYENVTRLIGVELYEYNFTVYNMAKDAVYTFGKTPSTPDNLIKIKRVGILNGKIVIVDVMVW